MDIDQTLSERGATHGDFNVHAGCTQDLKRTIEYWRQQSGKRNLTATEKEALDMICHKIGRIVAGDAAFPDHWIDIAGYAGLQERIIENRPLPNKDLGR